MNSLIQHIREQISLQPQDGNRINDALSQLQIEMNQKDALITQYRAVKESYPQWEKVKSTTPSHPA